MKCNELLSLWQRHQNQAKKWRLLQRIGLGVVESASKNPRPRSLICPQAKPPDWSDN
jgi:hypothetical protein